MSKKSHLNNHFKALLWSLFGLFFVFIVVIEMNEDGMVQKNEPKKAPLNFEVQKIEKAKPKPKPKPKPKETKPKPKKAAPTPNIGSSLSGIDTGLESFMSDDMGMDDSLLGDVGKDVVMSENSVDVAPKPSSRSAMEYPKKARKMAITGYVLLNLLVNANGNVVKVKVLESEPSGIFDDVAISGVKSWKFAPAQYKGKPVKVWAKQKIRFDLQ